MHIIRRLSTTYEFVLGNTPIIGVPVYAIAYYVALGNPGRNTWYVYAYASACYRLLGVRHSSLTGTISKAAYMRTGGVSVVVLGKIIAGTHIH